MGSPITLSFVLPPIALVAEKQPHAHESVNQADGEGHIGIKMVNALQIAGSYSGTEEKDTQKNNLISCTLLFHSDLLTVVAGAAYLWPGE